MSLALALNELAAAERASRDAADCVARARAHLRLVEAGEGPAAPGVAAPPVPPAPAAAQPPRLAPADYSDAAGLLRCDLAAVMAVRDVESNGAGFGPAGRPIILFEPHVFSRLTGRRFDSTHGGVSYPKWGAKPYPKGQAARWDQMLYAARLDEAAAYKSASWGLFQCMGFNHGVCGFSTVQAFVEAMKTGERAHLMAFVQFVLSNRLDDELREHRWAEFAERYNGPSFRSNKYDEKLASAHAKHSRH